MTKRLKLTEEQLDHIVGGVPMTGTDSDPVSFASQITCRSCGKTWFAQPVFAVNQADSAAVFNCPSCGARRTGIGTEV